MNQWYLAKSRAGKERILIDSLNRWSVGTFYPYIRQRGARDGRLEPLFRTYIFCHLDPKAPSWQAIRWSPGLAYFLAEADQPAIVPDSLIQYLQEKTRRWNEGAVTTHFTPGATVAIVRGPFAGFEAIFSGYVRSHERCQILLKSVQGISSMEIPEQDLEAATLGWRARFGFEAG